MICPKQALQIIGILPFQNYPMTLKISHWSALCKCKPCPCSLSHTMYMLLPCTSQKFKNTKYLSTLSILNKKPDTVIPVWFKFMTFIGIIESPQFVLLNFCKDRVTCDITQNSQRAWLSHISAHAGCRQFCAQTPETTSNVMFYGDCNVFCFFMFFFK